MRDFVKVGLFVLALSIGCVKPAIAGQFEDGWAAFKQGDYASTLSLWRPLAAKGAADAQFNLGLMYAKGLGVKLSNAEAAKWYRRAADQGDARAQNNLGVLYASGQGIAQNFVKAFMWFSLCAASQESSFAAQSRDTAAKHLTPAQLVEARRLAHDWRPKILAVPQAQSQKVSDRISPPKHPKQRAKAPVATTQ